MMSWPTTDSAVVTQERIAWLLTSTVQAPHMFSPQPYLVPVRPSRSLNTHSSGMAGLFTVTVWLCPFTLSVKVADTDPSLYWLYFHRKTLGKQASCCFV